MLKRRTPEERYLFSIRKQRETLEEFALDETKWAEDLLAWYSLRKKEIPFNEYRAAAFLRNGEYTRKPGSLTLLYEMYLRCMRELPECTKETAFDLLAYRFKMYARVLDTAGYA